MKKTIFLLSLITLLGYSGAYGQESDMSGDPDALFFHTDSLLSELQYNDQRWMAFLKGKNLLTGMYNLRSGEEDRQQPHDTDEVYYVIRGKAKLTAGGREEIVRPGSVLFVKAGVDHRFIDIEEDLVLLVFFDQ
ncbi:MAG TPA: cupin domain-containing protein [Eudoraea sp.]|nr:cupin domain-containing protein [Eudoraea sp.]